jgi:hypothetical protein
MTPQLATGTAPALGFAAAAKACGISESTLRRKRPELLAAGAVQTPKGWSIPVPVLVQLGLMDRTTAPDPVKPHDSPAVSAQGPVTTPATQSHLEPLLEALRDKLAEAEKRAAVAEARAEERERIIEAQARNLRMLEAPKPASQEQPAPESREQSPEPVPTAGTSTQEAPKRRWWRL